MKQKYFELLRKKQQGGLSLDEEQTLDQWLAADSEHQSDAKALAEIWPLSENYGAEANSNTDAALTRLMDRIHKDQTELESPETIRSISRVHLRWIAAAACLILTVGFAWQIWQSNARTPQWASLKTNESKVDMLALGDGSKVWINAKSTLNFPENIQSADRSLSLFGEAYFEVAPDKNRPFIIELSGAKVEVLGTAFNIRSYPNESEIELTVSHGKVRFSSPDLGQAYDLEMFDQIIYNRHTGAVEVKKDDNLWALSWQKKELQFQNTSLDIVIPALERYYNITITLDSPNSKNCPIKATFDTQTPDEALAIIARTNNMELKKTKDTYILIGGDFCN